MNASPIHDDTHSSSCRAMTSAFLGLIFFGFVAPLFGAISQIWLGFGGRGKCGCRFGGARDEEEDEVETVGMGSTTTLLYRIFPNIPHSRVFWEPFPRSTLLQFLRCGIWAVTWVSTQPQPMSLIYRCHQLLLAERSLTSPPFIEAQ